MPANQFPTHLFKEILPKQLVAGLIQMQGLAEP